VTKPRLLRIVGLLGVALFVVGIVLLKTEVALIRFTDVNDAVCGAPLDNRGWPTGSPCHGVVNRQTAIAWTTVVQGIALIVAAIVLTVRA
jgi:hypothetical protein